MSPAPPRTRRDRREPSVLHADLDAFYASVEQLADPSLRGRPVIVGGLGPRGVVAAASYEARRFGVHSATPMARARRACPDAVFLPPRFEAYAAASRDVMTILRSFTPLVEPIALDEAFLDVTGARRGAGAPEEIARAIRCDVRARTGLAVSVGGGTTKLVAKLASEACKPDGLLVVDPAGERAFLDPLPVRRLWGVGPATAARLEQLGVHTIADLGRMPVEALVARYGPAAGAQLHALARNEDPRAVEPSRPTKSIGHEETFPVDVSDLGALRRDARRMCERVGARLRGAGLTARGVQLKVRYGDFRTVTRSCTLRARTDVAAVLAEAVDGLLVRLAPPRGVRLLGVAAQRLDARSGATEQLALAVGDARSREPGGGAVGDDGRALEVAIDAVRSRFGDDAVGRAVQLTGDGVRTGRPGTRWGPSG